MGLLISFLWQTIKENCYNKGKDFYKFKLVSGPALSSQIKTLMAPILVEYTIQLIRQTACAIKLPE